MQTEYDLMDLSQLVAALRDQMKSVHRPLIIVGVSGLIAHSGINSLIQLASSDRVVCRSTLGRDASELFLNLNREWYFGNFQTEKPNIVFVVWEQPSEIEVLQIEGVEYVELDYFGNLIFADRERDLEQSIARFETLNYSFC